MRARVVIGACYGDEGKGLVTDYLCDRAGVVVRFNGGAQAGHTVVTPEGVRHVHHHFGSGTLRGVPTFLSRFFAVNPIMFAKELDELKTKLTEPPMVFADPQCRVTTFADMIINQRKEDKRGLKRHGSVGLGLHETMQRSQVPSMLITMADLWNNKPKLRDKLAESCDKWARYRTGSPIENADKLIDQFLKGCALFAEYVHPAGIGQCKNLDPVFEGAQGLLLDQDNKDAWPHVTHSKTGLHNAKILCDQLGMRPQDITAYYVSRTYLTRHGAGPLPGENKMMQFDDDTNLPHPYQGHLRFAPMDYDALYERIAEDTGNVPFKLVLTHCDQLGVPPSDRTADLFAFGPTRNDIYMEYQHTKTADYRR